jgi:hypothetical protein
MEVSERGINLSAEGGIIHWSILSGTPTGAIGNERSLNGPSLERS